MLNKSILLTRHERDNNKAYKFTSKFKIYFHKMKNFFVKQFKRINKIFNHFYKILFHQNVSKKCCWLVVGYWEGIVKWKDNE